MSKRLREMTDRAFKNVEFSNYKGEARRLENMYEWIHHCLWDYNACSKIKRMENARIEIYNIRDYKRYVNMEHGMWDFAIEQLRKHGSLHDKKPEEFMGATLFVDCILRNDDGTETIMKISNTYTWGVDKNLRGGGTLL